MKRGLTTAEAARALGVIPRRVRQLITEGRLKAEKVGRDLLIDAESVASFERQKRGPKPRRR